MPNSDPSGLAVFEFNMRFPGQYFDRETNLAYNWMRDYDPSKGRYAQSDPIGLRAGLNTYLYVKASPLIYGDMEGLALGGLPSQPAEDLIKKGPERIGNAVAAKFWGEIYGIRCAQRCKVGSPPWVQQHTLQLCVDEIVPAPVQANPYWGGTVVEVCSKTCYEQVPKICPPRACLGSDSNSS